MRIAWLGTGLLGSPMAEKLCDAGHEVVAWNRTRAKAEPLQAHGAVVAETARHAVGTAECVLLMLQDAEVIENVLFAEAVAKERTVDRAPNAEDGGAAAAGGTPAAGGASAHRGPVDLDGRTVIQMGTISSAESVHLAERVAGAGGDYLEAPVLGSIPQARSGTLIVMVGGSEEQFARWRPFLSCFGPQPLHVGPVGQAAILKLALNQLIASLTAAFSFSLGLVRRAGIEVDLFMRIVRESALYAPTYDKKLPSMLERRFSNPNFPARHLLKDVRLMLLEGERLGLEIGTIRAIEAILEHVQALGHAGSDYSSLYEAIDPA
ncbi:MAG: NAD(P)-dependent oxidoreductase [Candidatus Krumholzibacteriia bacterium]